MTEEKRMKQLKKKRNRRKYEWEKDRITNKMY